jgi:aminoglycoside phosphotransferase (APT) family kinase protein
VVDGSSLLGVLDWDEAALDAPEREFGLFLLTAATVYLTAY